MSSSTHTEEESVPAGGPGVKNRVQGIIATGMSVWDRMQNWRVFRSLSRYGVARGGLLAGGIAYSALFSIAAALTIAWTIFMSLLGSHEELRDQVITSVNTVLPNLLEDGSGQGLIDPSSLVLQSAFTPASIIAAGVLLWTAISMLSALGGSIRAMFGLAVMTENAIVGYVRALGGFVVMALGILFSSAFTIGAGTAGQALASWLGLGTGVVSWIIRIVTLLVSLGIDTLVVAFLVRVVAIVRVPRRDLVLGSLLAAALLTVIRFVGTSAVGSVSHNRLLVSFAALATLLLWLNLSARILLMSCAFMANPPRNESPVTAEQFHAEEKPNYVTDSNPDTLEWPRNPITGNLIPESTGDTACPSTPSSQQEEQDLGSGLSHDGRLPSFSRISLALVALWCSKQLIGSLLSLRNRSSSRE